MIKNRDKLIKSMETYKDMEHNIYMKTGEFAKLVGVSKETLFHYDDIGLFKADAVIHISGRRGNHHVPHVQHRLIAQ